MFLVLLFCINAVYSFPTRRELLTHALFKKMMEAFEETNDGIRQPHPLCEPEKECHQYKEGGKDKQVCIELKNIRCG